MITIGITDCNKFSNYERWLASETVQVLKLSSKENNISDLEKCDGIVLSGGEDVHPKYYGHPEWMERKDELKLDVNEARDEFEMKVIDAAYKKKIPMLGICRGLQIANVYFKGTLIPDINKENLKQHSKDSGADKIHNLKVESGSCLNGIISSNSGEVNSAHHQAADKIGEGLKVSARSEDGTIESLELKDPKQHPFLLLVQWHPERVAEQKNPFASGLKEMFIKKCST
ncbi:MAG: gamma-glutamyl-gamma-aminobutyrate hydrolase family protein [Bacteroidetes bacterium]|nr:MAG: gamma-glutamyl-gamma-aminobutyrate hydrolase family protein [Bacteroidota bacterium]